MINAALKLRNGRDHLLMQLTTFVSVVCRRTWLVEANLTKAVSIDLARNWILYGLRREFVPQFGKILPIYRYSHGVSSFQKSPGQTTEPITICKIERPPQFEDNLTSGPCARANINSEALPLELPTLRQNEAKISDQFAEKSSLPVTSLGHSARPHHLTG